MNDRFHEIDIHRLDEEWVAQVSMYREHADELAQAEYELDMAETELHVRKEELKETYARLDLMVRRAPEEYGFLKAPAEKAVENTVILQPEYKVAREGVYAAMRKVNEAKRDRNICSVAEKTVGTQRKQAIQDLVILHGRDYFAAPKVPRTGGGVEIKKAAADRAFGRRGSNNEST